MDRIAFPQGSAIGPRDSRSGAYARLACLAVLCACCLGLASCGSSPGGCLFCTTSTVRQFAYVANAGSNNVSAYNVNPISGALAMVPGSPFAAGTNPVSVVLAASPGAVSLSLPSASVQFAYAVNNGDGTVSAYSIDAASGSLANLTGSPFAVGAGPVSLTLLNPGPSVGTGILTVGTNFAYVVNRDSNNISAFTVDAIKGTLAPLAGSPFAAGLAPVSFTAIGAYAYVVDKGSNGVSAYSVDPNTGALSPVAGSPFATGASPVSFTAAFTSSQKTFAYVANSAGGDISAFAVQAGTGALVPVPGSPFAAGTTPIGMATSGGFLYVLNQGSNNVSAYALDPLTGSLAVVAGSPFPVGVNPVQLSAYQGLVYVVNEGSNNISVFTPGPSGALAPLAGSPFTTGTGPAALMTMISGQMVTPAGHQYFALVPNAGSNSVAAYTLDASGGQFIGDLSAVGGSPFTAGTGPDSVAAINTTVTVHAN